MTFPPTTDPVIAQWYQDLNTGCIYEIDETTGDYNLISCPSSGGGSTILTGSGPPSAGTGVDGDYYVDDATGTMYGPKDSAGSPVWPILIEAGVGPVGPAGPPGAGGIVIGNYRWKTDHFAPAAGFASSDTDPAIGAPNMLYLSETQFGGDSRLPYLQQIAVGDTVWVDDQVGHLVKAVVEDVSDEGDYWAITFTPDAAGQPANNAPITVGLVASEGGGTAADAIPPAAPVLVTFTSALTVDADGLTLVEIIATVTHPTTSADASPLEDLFATYVHVTSDYVKDPPPLDPENPTILWDNAALITIGTAVTKGVLLGVAGSTRYWGRAYSRDVWGNNSAFSEVEDQITIKDPIAPTVPTGLSAVPGYRSVGLNWQASSAGDLMFNEVRYAPDDGAGAPDTAAPTWSPPALRLRTNTVVVTDLVVSDPAKAYWFEVRAVDNSGNVATSDADPTAVDYLANPEAGWSARVSATPTLIGTEDLALNEAVIGFLASGVIDAGMITTGTLKVGIVGDEATGIEVWNGDVKVGYWDETGLYIGTEAEGLPEDLSSSDYTRMFDGGVQVFLNGVMQTAITPEGINASAINTGTLAGGMNLVQNSSFELAPFSASVPIGKDWTAAADWSGTQQSNTNATNGATAVTATARTY